MCVSASKAPSKQAEGSVRPSRMDTVDAGPRRRCRCLAGCGMLSVASSERAPRHCLCPPPPGPNPPLMEAFCRQCAANTSWSGRGGQSRQDQISGPSAMSPGILVAAPADPPPGGAVSWGRILRAQCARGPPLPGQQGWARGRWGQSLWTLVSLGLVFFLLSLPAQGLANPVGEPQYNGHYSNNGHRGQHSMADDEEYDEPEVFRLRGRHVTDTVSPCRPCVG